MAISAKIQPRLHNARVGPWILGVDEKSAAYALPPGKCRDAQNLLLDEKPGEAVKRFGARELSTLPSGNSPRDVGVFTKSDGTSYLLASDGATLYYTTDPSVQAGWTSLKTGLNTDGFMEFETAEDKVWMTNGIDAVMSWDGTTLFTYDRERTVTIDNVSIGATTVRNAQLTEADDYWNNQKLVFTTGANQGTVVTVTDFDAASDTITFTPAISGGATTDRFKVGLIIPKGRAVRFWDGHLWMASTTDNTSEARFHRLTDPNTGADIGIDHPLAWPSTYQIEVYAADGDRVWGISPVLRDRILFHKSSGLFRPERDPLTIYRIELVDRAVGSRFPRSWAEKKGLLYFVGQDKDGLPDVYKTDMVTVEPVDEAGGLEPTLRGLKQPNTIQKNVVLSSQADFDAGTKSTLVKTSNGKIEVGDFDTDADWNTNQSKNNVVIGNASGSVDILGIPTWEVKYSGDATPTSSSPAWTAVATAGVSESVPGGELTITDAPFQDRAYARKRSGPSSSQDAYFAITLRLGTNARLHFGIWNGSKAAWVGIIDSGGSSATVSVNGSSVSSGQNLSTFKTFHLLLRANGTWKLWLEGVLLASGSAATTSLSKVQFGLWNTGLNGDPLTVDNAFYKTYGGGADISAQTIYFDRVFYLNNLQDAASIPDTLPSSGTITMQIGYTRTPDSLKRVFHTSTLNGGTVALESWTSGVSDFSSDTDPAGFVAVANGAVPTSTVKQYQRIRITLTRADLVNSPELRALTTGILWLSAPISIGANIASWRTFLTTLTTPAGTDQEIKIRRATVTATPVEGDWGSFAVIVNGNNIGTILSDGSPPTSRWIQLKVEEGPDSSGNKPDVDAMTAQWVEGSSTILPLHGVVHKKRYWAAAAKLTSSNNDRVVVSDRNDAWMKYVGLNLNAMIHYKGQFLGFSSNTSKIMQLDVDGVLNDLGVAIDAFLDTREEVLKGGEELRKDLRFSYLHVGDVAHSLTTSYKRPSDSAFTGDKTLTVGTSTQDLRQNFGIGTVGRRFQRRYRNAVLDQGMSIRGETLYFAVRGPQQ